MGETRPPSDIAIASARVAAIVEAAERAADELREQAEARARERIAEAERAGAMRVTAAEDEAEDIMAAARKQAEAITRSANELQAAAEERKLVALQEATEIVERLSTEATEQAERTRIRARDDARALVHDARVVTAQVLREGTELSDNLRELSESLRRNAERILNDVKDAHARLTADLDRAMVEEPFVADARLPGDAGEAPIIRTEAVMADVADIPEYVPTRRRRREGGEAAT